MRLKENQHVLAKKTYPIKLFVIVVIHQSE